MKMALLACALLVGGSASADELARAPAARWRVTKGHLETLSDGRARVREPKMRAVVPDADGDEAELRFVYLGPSDASAPLGSGEMRRQIGLKLRAADGCNLLYVMWRIEPKAQLVVSLKSNPGLRTHRECGTHGYRNLVARAGAQPGTLAPGVEHRLHAKLEGRILRVWVDRALAWEGDVGAETLTLRGPAGVRSDNVRADFELLTRPATAPLAMSPGDDED